VVEFVDFFAGSVKGCYEPILNASGDPFGVLHLGPISDRDNGYFNLMNPACYQYPKENQCVPGERIREDDVDNLYRFTHGEQVTWRISFLQELADLLSGLAFLVVAIIAVYLNVTRRAARRPA
jgi:hypothetical protein